MVTWLSSAAAPCALFLLGVTVALRPLGRMPGEVPALVTIKLVLHPLLVWVLLSALGDFEPTWTYAAVVMAALPPALNIFVIATQYNVGVERASACVLVGTLVSMVDADGLSLAHQDRQDAGRPVPGVSAAMPLPLEGLTVLDFSTLLPGPLATFMLAEAGRRGDQGRAAGRRGHARFPPRSATGSAAFAVLNGGKRASSPTSRRRRAGRRCGR